VIALLKAVTESTNVVFFVTKAVADHQKDVICLTKDVFFVK